MSREIHDCFKRIREIRVKSVIPSQNTAFCRPQSNTTTNQNCALEVRVVFPVRDRGIFSQRVNEPPANRSLPKLAHHHTGRVSALSLF